MKIVVAVAGQRLDSCASLPPARNATKECPERTMAWPVRLCWTRFVRKKTALTRENRVVKGSVL